MGGVFGKGEQKLVGESARMVYARKGLKPSAPPPSNLPKTATTANGQAPNVKIPGVDSINLQYDPRGNLKQDDYALDADILKFPTNGFTSDTFNFDGVDYTLMLMGFSSDGGNTFVSEFDSPEESIAEAMLYAQIRAKSIPEPTTIAGLGLVGVYLAGSFKKRR